MNADLIYRNNAGRFRVEPGIQLFLPPTANTSNLSTVARPPGGSHRRQFPPPSYYQSSPRFFPSVSHPGTDVSIYPDPTSLVPRNASLQESCPSLLSTGHHRSFAASAGPMITTARRLQSSSAPNEGITGVDTTTLSPSVCSAVAVDNEDRFSSSVVGRRETAVNRKASVSAGGPVHLENPERETRWYFKYFLGKGKRFNIAIFSDERVGCVTDELPNHRATTPNWFGPFEVQICMLPYFCKHLSRTLETNVRIPIFRLRKPTCY